MKNLEVLGSYLLIRLLNCSSVVPFQMVLKMLKNFFCSWEGIALLVSC